MNIEKINQLRDFSQWARTILNKSSCVEIDFWSFRTNDTEEPEYRIYVEGLINKSSKNLDELTNLIPQFKLYCELNMEVSL